MSQAQAELKKTVATYHRREDVITREMSKLAERGYIKHSTANEVIAGYQLLTQEDIEVAITTAKKQAQGRNAMAQAKTNTTAQATAQRNFSPAAQPKRESLAAKQASQASTKPKPMPQPRPVKQVIAKTPEQIRERNLQFVLIAGVVLLFLAGAVLATTNWLFLTPIFKVSLIALIGVVFYVISVIAAKIKIPQTSQAFLTLSCLFAPFPFVSAAYYQSFGQFLSLSGPGRFLFGFILTTSFAIFYYFLGKKQGLSLLTRLSLGLAYLSLFFLSRTIFINTFLRSCLIILGVASFNHVQLKIKERFYPQIKIREWRYAQLIINGLSGLIILLSYQLTLSSTILLGLLALLFLQLEVSLQTKQAYSLILSYLLLGFNFISANLLINQYQELWSGLISALVLVVFGFAQAYYQRANKLTAPSLKLSFYYLITSGILVPLAVLRGAGNQLYGYYFSLHGEGKFIFLFALFSLVTLSYYFLGLRLNVKIFTYLSLGISLFSFLSLSYALPLIPFWRMIVNFVALGSLNQRQWRFKTTLFPSLLKNYWKIYLLAGNFLIVLVSSFSLPYSLAWSFFFGLVSLLTLQLTSQAVAQQRLGLLISYSTLVFAFVASLLLMANLRFHWASFASSLIVLIYTLCHLNFQRQERFKQNTQRLKIYFNGGLVLFFTSLFLIQQVNLFDYDLALSSVLASLTLVIAIALALLVPQTKAQRSINLPTLAGLAYLIVFQVVTLAPLLGIWQFRLLVVVLVGLYCYLVRNKQLSQFIVAITGVSYVFYCLLQFLLLPTISMAPWELVCWNLLLWGSYLITALAKQQLNQKIARFLPFILVFSVLPLTIELNNFITIPLSLSILSTLVGWSLKEKLAPNFYHVSLWLSSFLYLLSFGGILLSASLAVFLWPVLLTFVWGGILAWLMGQRFKQALFFQWLPFSYLFSLLYPLLIFQWQASGNLVYLNLLLIFTYGVIRRENKKLNFYFSDYLLTGVVAVIWSLTIGLSWLNNNLDFSWLALILPLLIVADTYRQARPSPIKYVLILINLVVVTSLINLSALQFNGEYLAVIWQTFFISCLLSLVYYTWPSERLYFYPFALVSLLANLGLFLVETRVTGELIPLKLGAVILSLVLAASYFIKSQLPQKLQLLILFNLIYLSLLLNTQRELANVVLPLMIFSLMLVSSWLFYQAASPLIKSNHLSFDFVIVVQLVGLLSLINLSVPSVWLKLYCVAWLLIFSFLEKDLVIQKIQRTIATVLVLSLCFDGLDAYLRSDYPAIALAIFYAVVLIALSSLARGVWQQTKLARNLEWLLSGLFLIDFLISSLRSQDLSLSLTGAVFALALVVVAYVTKYSAYFINGLIYLVIFILYSQRHFWAALPWWLYLALSGILLIGLGSFSEWNRRNQKVSRTKLQAQVRNYFINWK